MSLSRIGKQPITVPNGVNVSIHNGSITVKASTGELE